MVEKKVIVPKTTPKKVTIVTQQVNTPLFYKENYLWMGIGAAVIALGMLLMGGGKNTDINQFDYNLVYSTRRITIAPILIIAGLLMEIYAIFKRPKPQQHKQVIL